MDRGRRRCARHLGRLACMLRCERCARCCCGTSGAPDATRGAGATGGADGAAGRDRAAAPQHMVGDLHTRTDVLWWCALHCKIPTLQWVGVYIGLDEQYQCTGLRARGLTEECGELGRAASGAPVLSLYMYHHQ